MFFLSLHNNVVEAGAAAVLRLDALVLNLKSVRSISYTRRTCCVVYKCDKSFTDSSSTGYHNTPPSLPALLFCMMIVRSVIFILAQVWVSATMSSHSRTFICTMPLLHRERARQKNMNWFTISPVFADAVTFPALATRPSSPRTGG